MHPVRRPELRQISSETYILSKPGTSIKLYLDAEDVEDLGEQIQLLTGAWKTVA